MWYNIHERVIKESAELAADKGKTDESQLRKAIGSKGKPMTASYREDFGYRVIKSFSRHGKPS